MYLGKMFGKMNTGYQQQQFQKFPKIVTHLRQLRRKRSIGSEKGEM